MTVQSQGIQGIASKVVGGTEPILLGYSTQNKKVKRNEEGGNCFTMWRLQILQKGQRVVGRFTDKVNY